jgi:hypothetical protein
MFVLTSSFDRRFSSRSENKESRTGLEVPIPHGSNVICAMQHKPDLNGSLAVAPRLK